MAEEWTVCVWLCEEKLARLGWRDRSWGVVSESNISSGLQISLSSQVDLNPVNSEVLGRPSLTPDRATCPPLPDLLPAVNEATFPGLDSSPLCWLPLLASLRRRGFAVEPWLASVSVGEGVPSEHWQLDPRGL